MFVFLEFKFRINLHEVMPVILGKKCKLTVDVQFCFPENAPRHQKVIEKCRNKLVTDMSVIHIATRLHKDGKIQDECLKEIKVSIYRSICLSVYQYLRQLIYISILTYKMLTFRAKRQKGCKQEDCWKNLRIVMQNNSPL